MHSVCPLSNKPKLDYSYKLVRSTSNTRTMEVDRTASPVRFELIFKHERLQTSPTRHLVHRRNTLAFASPFSCI